MGKLESVVVDLVELVASGPAGLQVWHRPCSFDHPETAVTAVVCLLDGGKRSICFQLYGGRLSGKLVHLLRWEGGSEVSDPEKFVVGLERRGYMLANPPTPEPDVTQEPEPVTESTAEPEPTPAPVKRRGRTRKATTEAGK